MDILWNPLKEINWVEEGTELSRIIPFFPDSYLFFWLTVFLAFLVFLNATIIFFKFRKDKK